MILRFLRFWNHPLLADLAKLQTDNAVLQDRLERGDSERDRLWEQNRELLANLENYHRMDRNIEWQSTGRPAPFMDAPHLPSNMVPQIDNTPQPAHRSQGSQMVAKAKSDFRLETARRMGVELVAD